jgi:hypothetical protein|nr:MAG TPA: hypothetical protein [Bacteriophage sp.]
MINVNAWTSYSEKIGNEYYFVTVDGYKNYRVEITKGNKIDSKFCTYGSIEDVEKMLEEAREKAGVTVLDVRESWKLENDIYGI